MPIAARQKFSDGKKIGFNIVYKENIFIKERWKTMKTIDSPEVIRPKHQHKAPL